MPELEYLVVYDKLTKTYTMTWFDMEKLKKTRIFTPEELIKRFKSGVVDFGKSTKIKYFLLSCNVFLTHGTREELQHYKEHNIVKYSQMVEPLTAEQIYYYSKNFHQFSDGQL
jgi:hypothetical protein